MNQDILQNCTLCPRCCGVNRLIEQKGFCGMGSTLVAARAALHMWEEPCLVGKHGSGTVFFSGCTLKCVFCQNYQISTLNHGLEISCEKLAQAFLYLQEQGALNINLVTPTHFVPQIIQALHLAKNSGLRLPVVYNSSGYENVSTVKILKGSIDIYMPDFKYHNDNLAIKYSNAPNYRQKALEAIKAMLDQVGEVQFDRNGIMQKGVLVRHMLLPNLLEDSKKAVRELYQLFGDRIYISLMSQYTPLSQVVAYAELNRRVKKSDYQKLVDYALNLGISNGFVQKGESALESFIPDFNGVGL